MVKSTPFAVMWTGSAREGKARSGRYRGIPMWSDSGSQLGYVDINIGILAQQAVRLMRLWYWWFLSLRNTNNLIGREETWFLKGSIVLWWNHRIVLAIEHGWWLSAVASRNVYVLLVTSDNADWPHYYGFRGCVVNENAEYRAPKAFEPGKMYNRYRWT